MGKNKFPTLGLRCSRALALKHCSPSRRYSDPWSCFRRHIAVPLPEATDPKSGSDATHICTMLINRMGYGI